MILASEQDINDLLVEMHNGLTILLDNKVISEHLYDELDKKLPTGNQPVIPELTRKEYKAVELKSIRQSPVSVKSSVRRKPVSMKPSIRRKPITSEILPVSAPMVTTTSHSETLPVLEKPKKTLPTITEGIGSPNVEGFVRNKELSGEDHPDQSVRNIPDDRCDDGSFEPSGDKTGDKVPAQIQMPAPQIPPMQAPRTVDMADVKRRRAKTVRNGAVMGLRIASFANNCVNNPLVAIPQGISIAASGLRIAVKSNARRKAEKEAKMQQAGVYTYYGDTQ